MVKPDLEFLPFLGGDVAGRLADLVLDLEDFGFLSGDLDGRRPATIASTRRVVFAGCGACSKLAPGPEGPARGAISAASRGFDGRAMLGAGGSVDA